MPAVAMFERVRHNPVFWTITRKLQRRMLRRAMLNGLDGPEVLVHDRAVRLFPADLAALADGFEPQASQLRLHAERAALPTIGNRLMVELAVFTMAACRVLVNAGIAPDAARQLVADIGRTVYARALHLASLPVRLATPDPAKRLRWTIKALLRFPFSARGVPGYAADVWIDGDDVHTHFTHCPPERFVRRLAARDDRNDLATFQLCWCRYDWPSVDLIAADGARGHYQRSQTLSAGVPVCDMCCRGRASGSGGTPQIPMDAHT